MLVQFAIPSQHLRSFGLLTSSTNDLLQAWPKRKQLFFYCLLFWLTTKKEKLFFAIQTASLMYYEGLRNKNRNWKCCANMLARHSKPYQHINFVQIKANIYSEPCQYFGQQLLVAMLANMLAGFVLSFKLSPQLVKTFVQSLNIVCWRKKWF